MRKKRYFLFLLYRWSTLDYFLSKDQEIWFQEIRFPIKLMKWRITLSYFYVQNICLKQKTIHSILLIKWLCHDFEDPNPDFPTSLTGHNFKKKISLTLTLFPFPVLWPTVSVISNCCSLKHVVTLPYLIHNFNIVWHLKSFTQTPHQRFKQVHINLCKYKTTEGY